MGDGEFVYLAPGESCAFEVVFQPSQNGEHNTELSFRSDTQLDRHRIQLSGNGLSGALSFSEPDMPPDADGNPVLPTPGACFNAALDPVDSCTPYRTIVATNAGPGTITVTGASVAPIAAGLDSGFELDPAIPPQVALNGGATQELRIRWCEGLGAPEETDELLTVNSDDPALPTFILALRRQVFDCPIPSFPP